MSETVAEMTPIASEKIRWTTADIDLLPQDEFTRYEIIVAARLRLPRCPTV